MNKKKHKISPPMLVVVAFTALFLVYLSINVLALFTNTLTTTVATYVVAEESFSGSGWFFRDETVMKTTNEQDTVQYVAFSGEKVKAQAVLATIYDSAMALEINRQISALEAQISLLDTALLTAGGYVESAKVDGQIADKMEEIDTYATSNSVVDLDDAATELRELFLRRNATNLDSTSIKAEIEQLEAEITTLESKMVIKSRDIVAPSAGYFSETVDGYESILTTDLIETLTPVSFIQLIEQEPEVDATAFGKIVSGFTWNFVMIVTHEQAEQLTVGQSVDLRFSQTDDFTATVQNIVYDVSDQALVVFENNQITSEVISMRNQTVEVILATYEGIRVPKAAITLSSSSSGVEPALGVYILTGETSRFKLVEKVYEGENYYLVKQGTSDTTGIVVGDKIITYATGLSDLKVVL